MKLLMMLVVGVLLGAAGYWWLEREAPQAALAPASAAAPAVTARSDAAEAAMAAPSAAPAVADPAVAASSPSTEMMPAANTPAAPASAAAPEAASSGSGLLIPVQGIGSGQLQDTFTDARSEGRVHDAIDILAPTGTPVIAVADGTVEKLFNSERGGLTVYQFDPNGTYCYYYAHLERYADGLAEKQAIKRGQVIGYVGSTGNADPAAPHLHFEIHRLGPEKQWWKGEVLNPYPVLHGDQTLQ
ncbi:MULTISPECIES: M23 family metallopeptidase [Xanthomonas]|uniref:Murein DD-endopeptidase MepM/ murein hydrolase activator NlpD n=1 Tax=Xanthomonas arboricola TaxID=56448 RepID=A0AB73GY53_9XANT|nr:MULTISPECIES: M23 family metallopeptidase [Xanthomonas]MBB3759952.1 murein DD-endopeptidase MepM/ murein hydrolase activator NlpD [Xanthomonas arboricola]MBB3795938.1 murein DD-endopeptidase MepM/ murein hydrolase activator NlpD [Xanthomonas arboricola]MBB4595523.1 murein DD-endopeptidase MepM/ murein hydrolase activator NlpD [Xanthomonas arboricola]MBB5670353.1 murein DD-endopeptidase MepM/ murein hydrolase activator NlpD [Xanthomonas arboricola]PPU32928.1 endopeptidase [Xanthomonas arbori